MATRSSLVTRNALLDANPPEMALALRRRRANYRCAAHALGSARLTLNTAKMQCRAANSGFTAAILLPIASASRLETLLTHKPLCPAGEMGLVWDRQNEPIGL